MSIGLDDSNIRHVLNRIRRFTRVFQIPVRHHLLLFIAFTVALTFIMLFIFNLIFRPSLFIRFSSPLQCHFLLFLRTRQRIHTCDASFNRKMSPPRSVIRQVTGHRFNCRCQIGKALFRYCYCHDVMILIMAAVSLCRRTPKCGCRIKIFILRGTIMNY